MPKCTKSKMHQEDRHDLTGVAGEVGLKRELVNRVDATQLSRNFLSQCLSFCRPFVVSPFVVPFCAPSNNACLFVALLPFCCSRQCLSFCCLFFSFVVFCLFFCCLSSFLLSCFTARSRQGTCQTPIHSSPCPLHSACILKRLIFPPAS